MRRTSRELKERPCPLVKRLSWERLSLEGRKKTSNDWKRLDVNCEGFTSGGRRASVDAVGASGGLISLWNEDNFKIRDCITHKRCIILAGILVKLNKEAIFYNVYRPSLQDERRELWDVIMRAQMALSGP
ncbi:hypothetical protein Dsin_001343 [Dipteronia sinensis]|uniref:Uncharacterized protein n=1 Tax=Dipteronia sinensis TaxID=43782 RepID=A0AAE0EIX1_9ROSI|nr:hypothetical protein Dsin_001343 [Dipteronia sinensis]